MRLLVLLMGVFFASCSPKNATKNGVFTPVFDAKTTYSLTSLALRGQVVALPDGRRPTVQFPAPDQISGFAGVNRYTMAFPGGQAVATKMAGPPAAMALENQFLEALQLVTKIERRDGGAIRLTSPDGATRLEFGK
jgi:heat shock protein HslJ